MGESNFLIDPGMKMNVKAFGDYVRGEVLEKVGRKLLDAVLIVSHRFDLSKRPHH
jgi:hypothetical protein